MLFEVANHGFVYRMQFDSAAGEDVWGIGERFETAAARIFETLGQGGGIRSACLAGHNLCIGDVPAGCGSAVCVGESRCRGMCDGVLSATDADGSRRVFAGLKGCDTGCVSSGSTRLGSAHVESGACLRRASAGVEGVGVHHGGGGCGVERVVGGRVDRVVGDNGRLDSEVKVGVETGDGGGEESRFRKEKGRWYYHNQAKKIRRRLANASVVGAGSNNWRSPASVESSEGSMNFRSGRCWTVKDESPMEKRAREALEKKRAMEAELAARRAELALGRMNDKTMTDLYDARVKQEGICRMNQATQRSEKCLEQLRSVSPGSSATPGEIREALLLSETWKLKEKKIREWAAGSGHGNEVLVLLDEGKSTEVEFLDTEDRALLDEYGTGSEADEDRYVEPSQAMKDETAKLIRLSHKHHVEYVIRRLRGTGRDPAANLIGAELEYYQAMTAEEIANVV